MQTTPVPYVNPSAVTFYLDGCKQAQNFEILNPFSQDFLFKVDNAHPDKYRVSLSQGVVCSHQKVIVEVSCISSVISSNESIQVRFFKSSRPRHGQKPKAQLYIGYRVVNLNIFHNASERERTPSDHGSSRSGGSNLSKENPNLGSTNISSNSSDFGQGSSDTCARKRVITDIIITICLLVLGFVFKYINEDWFLVNVLDEVKPQTLAIVFFTLACVMMLKLLTFR
ncbi:hypothetical protein Bpfe_004069 [Biomphalaria pfeifferi]|uniref:Motile sperm domain-containing protein 1 n=1 Tax=Biomphalaria pfeifferi TaxID=112525 RepID=A0AAD8C641_BIOPF|nr:hypothetical protein Bpfe_004069 [Biomphalaria pfeifferi]